MLRVAVIFYNIGPYHAARLAAASRLLHVVGLEWSARESYSRGQPAENGSYEKVSLFDHAGRGSHGRAALASRLCVALEDTKPHVVAVNGWDDFGSSVVMHCCARRGLPMVLMSESMAIDARRSCWKEALKGRVVRLASAGLAGGRAHADYLASLGIPRDRIVTGYDVVDNQHFARGAAAARANSGEVREALGLPQEHFLASSRFIPKKNIPMLLRAYAQYRQQCAGRSWDLVLLGDGPLRPEIEALVTQLGLRQCVHLPGFRQYEELPAYYGLAGAFVHASTVEQWGLVVNEAMASGLPVLVSNRCGCVHELVRDGENGYLFDPADGASLARLMTEIASDPDRREAMGRRSSELIREWGPDRFARGLLEAAECALRVGPPPRRWLDGLILRLLAMR